MDEPKAAAVAPADWRESLNRSKAQIAAGEAIPLLPVLDRLHAGAERIEAEQGHSMEVEAQRILQAAPDKPSRRPTPNLYERIRARMGPLGGVDFDLPSREPVREPLPAARPADPSQRRTS